MINKLFIAFLLFLLIFSGCTSSESSSSPSKSTQAPLQVLRLPQPRLTSEFSLEETLSKRRSVREYSETSLSLEEVSQLLWSAQGVTSSSGGRTAPSAGGLYPLEIYVIAGNISDLIPGVYHYLPATHELELLKNQDLRQELSGAALNQTAIVNGAIDIVITTIYDRITPRYGERGIRYAYLEAGHAAQNICLQAVALKLGTVTIGAFEDNRVKEVSGLAENETPLYILPVGKTS
jgi:SagB-type dehydrogenase family enzyme